MPTDFPLESAYGPVSQGLPTYSPWPPFPWNPPGLPNDLIGRDDTCAALGRAIDDAVSHWSVRLHLVVSGHGLGKSRVLRSVLDEASARHPDLHTVSVRCPAVSGGGGLFRFWDVLFRGLFNIPANLDAVSARAALSRELSRVVVPDDADFLARALLGGSAAASSHDEDADVARCSTIVGRVLETLAFQKPLVLLVDDAHRGNRRDFALTAAVPATAKGRPVLLLLSGSPLLADHLPGWERLPVTHLGLISAADSERMLRLYFSGLKQLPSRALIERLVETGAGNPFALKSLVRWLAEARGITQEGGAWRLDETRVLRLKVPDTLEGVAHARFMALDDKDRDLLAQAASIGREFWTGALVAIVRRDTVPASPAEIDFLGGAHLDEIRGRLNRFVEQRILEIRTSRLRGEDCYGFRTQLHWQVALEGLPTTTIQVYHRVILAWLTRQAEALRAAGENDSALERELARHAEASGLPAVAAEHHHRAAQASLAEGHPRAALESLESALRLASPIQLSLRLQLTCDIAGVYQQLGTTGLAHEYSDAALALAWRLGDRRSAARVLSHLADLEAGRGEHVVARKHLVQALRIYELLQDPHGIGAGSLQLGRWYWQLGDFDKALMCFSKAAQIYQQLSDLKGIADVMHARGAVHYDRGDIQDAQAAYERALELRREAGDKRGIAKTLSNLAAVWISRRLDRSVKLWEEALEMSREIGDLVLQASIANNLGEVLMLLDKPEEARSMLQRAVELAELTGMRGVLIDALRNEGVLAQREGDFVTARSLFQRASDEAASLGVLRLQALVSRALGDLELALVEETGVVDGEGTRLGEAERHFVASAHDFEAGRYDLEAAETWDRIARVLTLGGRADEGRAAQGRALALRRAHEKGTEPPPLPVA